MGVEEDLKAIREGDPGASGRLMAELYDSLRSMAGRFLSRESAGHTLQPTDLVNEAYLKMVRQTQADWQGKTHFMAVGAQAMRRILIDHARTRGRQKRGGSRKRVPLDDGFVLTSDHSEEVLWVDEAIDRLAKLDPVHARIVEYRLFGGMTNEEIAAVLGVTSRTVERHWTVIRAWLLKEMGK
jgi:RNA polymerase sigma factor (TIGR02999 family)